MGKGISLYRNKVFISFEFSQYTSEATSVKMCMVGFRTSTKEIIEHIYSGNIIKESVTLGNFQCKAM